MGNADKKGADKSVRLSCSLSGFAVWIQNFKPLAKGADEQTGL